MRGSWSHLVNGGVDPFESLKCQRVDVGPPVSPDWPTKQRLCYSDFVCWSWLDLQLCGISRILLAAQE